MVMDRVMQNVVVATSQVEGPTAAPVVHLTCASQEFQVTLTPMMAVKLASELAGAASTAVEEAFLVIFLQQQMGADPKMAYEALDQFRLWRDGHLTLH